MATWHQTKSRVRLFHDTMWTALTDPPHGMRSIMLFATEREAAAYAARVPHTIVLKPAKGV